MAPLLCRRGRVGWFRLVGRGPGGRPRRGIVLRRRGNDDQRWKILRGGRKGRGAGQREAGGESNGPRLHGRFLCPPLARGAVRPIAARARGGDSILSRPSQFACSRPSAAHRIAHPAKLISRLDDFRAPSSALLSYPGRKAELPGCNAQNGNLERHSEDRRRHAGLANALQRGDERNSAVTALVELAGDSRLA
jgi:hypothetical protein